MDLVTIQGTLSGLKTAADLAKSLVGLKSMAEVQGKVVELQQAILSAQSSALAAQGEQGVLADEVRQLRDELNRVRAWEQQKQRYKLISPFKGRVVYALRASQSNGEPPHWVCTKCFEDGRRSILNASEVLSRRAIYRCPTCKSEVESEWSNITEAQYATD